MRIIIELSKDEAERREAAMKAAGQDDQMLDAVDAEFHRAAVDIARAADGLSTVRGVDLGYAIGPSYARARLGDEVVQIRFTLVGDVRGENDPVRVASESRTRAPLPLPRKDCECDDEGALRGYLHMDNSDITPELGYDGQHIESCGSCQTLPDDDAARAAHDADCGCDWGKKLQPNCPCCNGVLVLDATDHMVCACGYSLEGAWWREHAPRIDRGCPEGCDCEKCRPELYVAPPVMNAAAAGPSPASTPDQDNDD